VEGRRKGVGRICWVPAARSDASSRRCPSTAELLAHSTYEHLGCLLRVQAGGYRGIGIWAALVLYCVRSHSHLQLLAGNPKKHPRVSTPIPVYRCIGLCVIYSHCAESIKCLDLFLRPFEYLGRNRYRKWGSAAYFCLIYRELRVAL